MYNQKQYFDKPEHLVRQESGPEKLLMHTASRHRTNTKSNLTERKAALICVEIWQDIR